MRILAGLILLIALPGTTVGVAQHWPHWRGPTHDGVSLEKGLPDTWSATCASSGDVAEEVPHVGGPSDQRPPGSNFEGRPMVAAVCANIETKGI